MRAIGASLHWPRVGAAHAQLFWEVAKRTRFEPRARAVGQSLSKKEA